MRNCITRRALLGVAAGAGAGLVVLKDAALARAMAANEALAIGLVGAGGRGRWFCDLLPRTRGMKLVALCDVDEFKAKPSYEQFPDLPKFPDFRIMLQKMRDKLDGAIVASSHNMTCKFLPKNKGQPPPAGPPTPRSVGHEHEWAAAIRGGPAAWSNYDYSSALNEMLMLGNVSSQVPGEDLEYDPLACKVVGNDKADGFLRRQYREGWTL
jgi:hypothetical protein